MIPMAWAEQTWQELIDEYDISVGNIDRKLHPQIDYSSFSANEPYNKCPETHSFAIKKSTGEHICAINLDELIKRNYAIYYLDYLHHNQSELNPSNYQLAEAAYQRMMAHGVVQKFIEKFPNFETTNLLWENGGGGHILYALESEDSLVKIISLNYGNRPEPDTTTFWLSCKYYEPTDMTRQWSTYFYHVWDERYYQAIDLIENGYCLDDAIPKIDIRQYDSGWEHNHAGCDPSYPSICIERDSLFMSCMLLPVGNFLVIGDDPYNFDSDDDGIGCESQ